MTVFVAGVHAVGKSHLCQQYARAFSTLHESSSGLIRKERAQSDWSYDKKVVDVDGNQRALQNAVRRIALEKVQLLLDGHFVLIGQDSNFVRLGEPIFADLNLSGVILLEAGEELIASRLSARDSSVSAVDISHFLQAEREQAQLVCENLRLPLHILHEPSFEGFSHIAHTLFKSAKMEY